MYTTHPGKDYSQLPLGFETCTIHQWTDSVSLYGLNSENLKPLIDCTLKKGSNKAANLHALASSGRIKYEEKSHTNLKLLMD